MSRCLCTARLGWEIGCPSLFDRAPTVARPVSGPQHEDHESAMVASQLTTLVNVRPKVRSARRLWITHSRAAVMEKKMTTDAVSTPGFTAAPKPRLMSKPAMVILSKICTTLTPLPTAAISRAEMEPRTRLQGSRS